MGKKYDDFDEGDSDGFFDQVLNIISNRKREFAIVSVAAAVILLGAIVLGSYPDSQDDASESVPIVRADATDYKTAPDNPGGMEIPYRDSTVFSSVDGQKPEGTENILADEGTEEPLNKSQAFAGLNTEGDQPGGAPVPLEEPAPITTADNKTGGEVEDTLAKVESVEPPSNDQLVKEAIGTNEQATASQQTATATVPEAFKDAVKEPVEEAAKDNAKIESAAGTTAPKAISSGNSYVQLASVKSTAGAAGEYKKLQAKYSGLSGVDFRTQEANLGAKGIFHRIQAGPMSKADATRICNDIKAKGGSCLVAGK